MISSITGLKANNFLGFIRFQLLTLPTFMQARKASGNLFCEAKKVADIHHTLTAWKSEDDLINYISSGTHLKAMKTFSKIATGKTYRFEADEIPTWEEAVEIWNSKAKSV